MLWTFDPAKRLLDWLREGPRKDRLERRESPRRTVAGLIAHYWGGTSTAGHMVRDISASGAFILADFKWLPGTIVTMTLRSPGQGDGSSSFSSMVVQAMVVRQGQAGIGVQFICDSKGERKRLEKFLESLPNVES